MSQPLQRQIIARALPLVADEAMWTRGVMARNQDGVVCNWSSPTAARFCAMGALMRAALEFTRNEQVAQSLAMEAADQILKANNRVRTSLSIDNDLYGRAHVVQLFERALASETAGVH